ncbi:MAG: (2Fe-2S)-binding protein [Gammaproteobacteria bacterium]|nr:MAG: (2Fe-2S)-binding protein [Gammaproteobacteria bacterium]
MKKLIELDINDEVHELAVRPDASLLNVLRGELGLVGPKKGCDTGGCGCCSVEVDGKVVYSCMVYAASVEGRKIRTVEGIGTADSLHPLQQAFIDAGAVQCGYCTSGMLMAAKQLLETNPSPDDDEIRQAIAGNLCRCTGYSKIVDAIRLAASRMAA